MTKYDDVGWHIESAIDARQPEENAGVHIGLYLGWLIRRDLHNPEFFPDLWVEAIKSREASGTEALDTVDGKLTSEDMTPEADAFTAWYYDRYLGDFERLFRDRRPFSIEDDRPSQMRIELQIDARFAEWIESERPEPKPQKEHEGPAPEPYMIEVPPREEWEWFSDESRALLEAEIADAERRGIKVAFGPTQADMPHAAPALESLIPTDLGLKISSVTGSQWGRLPKKLLDGVGVTKKDARVANGIGRGVNGALLVSIYGFPGASAADLDREAGILFTPPMSITEATGDRQIGRRSVHWTRTSEWTQAWWAVEERLIMCTAPDDTELETLIARIPGP